MPFFNGNTFPTIFSTLPLLRNIFVRERVQIVHGHQVAIPAKRTRSHEYGVKHKDALEGEGKRGKVAKKEGASVQAVRSIPFMGKAIACFTTCTRNVARTARMTAHPRANFTTCCCFDLFCFSLSCILKGLLDAMPRGHYPRARHGPARVLHGPQPARVRRRGLHPHEQVAQVHHVRRRPHHLRLAHQVALAPPAPPAPRPALTLVHYNHHVGFLRNVRQACTTPNADGSVLRSRAQTDVAACFSHAYP